MWGSRRKEKQFFLPEVIKGMKQTKLKEKQQLPDWGRIEELVSHIQEKTIVIDEIRSLNKLQSIDKCILNYQDLTMTDVSYHLIVNHHFDLFLQILQCSKPLYTPELNQIIQSTIKGLIKIKSKINYIEITKFLKALRTLLKTEEGTELYTNFVFQFDIVIRSHFNYKYQINELNLLFNCYKLLGSSIPKEESEQLKFQKQQLEFTQYIISKKENRRTLEHLGYKTKTQKYQGFSIYRQICEDEVWDKISHIVHSDMFIPIQDGFSPYMKMLKYAPCEFLTNYHNEYFNEIKCNVSSQINLHGYNMLHCIAENSNKVTQEFVHILQELHLDDYKSSPYFDQIPLVCYMDKQKQINDSFKQYLLNGAEMKSYRQKEGIQIVGQLFAKYVYEMHKQHKPSYKRLYKFRNFKSNKDKIKSVYKQSKPTFLQILDKSIIEEFTQIYQNLVQIHNIHKIKGVTQEFEISQYSFSNCDLNYMIFNIEQPVINLTLNSNVLERFLHYIEHQYGQNISEHYLRQIQVFREILKNNLTLEQLVLQRKVIILNSLLKKYESINQAEQCKQVKITITNILNKSDNNFDVMFCSHSKYSTFVDFLQCNDLIPIAQYISSDPFSQLRNLLSLNYQNCGNLIYLAEAITSDDQVSVNSLGQFQIPPNMKSFIVKVSTLKVFILNIFQDPKYLAKLQTTSQGIKLLYEGYKKKLPSTVFKQILRQYNPDTYLTLLNIFHQLYQPDEIFHETGKKQNRLKYFHIEQSQLQHLCYYQLKGIQISFNIHWKKLKLQSTCLEEEIVLKQIKENKTFLQVLVSNDKYYEFTQEYLKIFELFQKDSINYVAEALYYCAERTLELLEKHIFNNLEKCQHSAIFQQTLFLFLKQVSPTYFGFATKIIKGIQNNYPLQYDNLAKLCQIDSKRLNQQIKTFYSVFERQIKQLEQSGISFFVVKQKELYLMKQLFYYLDLENVQLLIKYVTEYLKLSPPETLFNQYKWAKNSEITIFLLNHSEMKITCKNVAPFANIILPEELHKELILKCPKDIVRSTKVWANRALYHLVQAYFMNQCDLQFIKHYLEQVIFSPYQYQQMVLFCLFKNEIRKIELLLIILSTLMKFVEHPIDGNTTLPMSNYLFALKTGWSLGLNVVQFKQLIDHNELNQLQKNQVLQNLAANGHYEKLKLVLGWVENQQQLYDLAYPAISHYIDIKNYHGLRQVSIQGYLKFKYDYSISFSPFENEIKTQDIKQISHEKEIKPKQQNNKCLFSSNFFQTDITKTAILLYDTLIKSIPDNEVFPDGYWNAFCQTVFPNSKYLAPDSDGKLLKQIIDVVTKKKNQQHWDIYLELIEKNIENYNDTMFDIQFIFLFIEIEEKRGQFFKKMIDIFMKAQKLTKTLNEENFKDKKPYQIYRRSQYLFNANRQQQIKKNRYTDILSHYFGNLSFDEIKITERQLAIYYGKPFENGMYNEQDLFIALMSRRQSSILKILESTNNCFNLINQHNIIQYLIMHGGQETVIKVLSLLNKSEINSNLFYLNDLPLLTYVVIKKWYKLYAFAEQYLIEQWNLKPQIIVQIENNNKIEMSIHQFALLNQFYVYFQLPLENKLLQRTSSFLIPNQHNSQLQAYKTYKILVELFPTISKRKIEIFSLEHQAIEISSDQPITTLLEFFNKQNQFPIQLHALLSIYQSAQNKQSQLVNQLIIEMGIKFEVNLQKFTNKQLRQLFDCAYDSFGLYHPIVEEIIRIAPLEFFDEKILDSPRLTIIASQQADLHAIKNLLEQSRNCNTQKTISLHFIKLFAMIKFGQNYDIFNREEEIHLKYYIEALDLIEQNHNGNITNQFLDMVGLLLQVENDTMKNIDYFYRQTENEQSSIKRALKLIIKIKEFNYTLEQVKEKAIAKTDYLITNFSFEISDIFQLKMLGAANIISIPVDYQEKDLEEFLSSLPCYYKAHYEKAIMKASMKSHCSREKDLKIKIKFEEQNLSLLYNDLRFLLFDLKSQLKPKQILGTKNQDSIIGWQKYEKNICFENIFVYTTLGKPQVNWFEQLFYQNPSQLELMQKYPDQLLVFFNTTAIMNQGEIQFSITESIRQLIKNSLQGLDIKIDIDLNSYIRTFLMNEKLINQYRNWNDYGNAISSFQTLILILNHILQYVEQILGLFELESIQCIIKFELMENAGITSKTSYLDQYFSFGKGSLKYEQEHIFLLLPVSNLVSVPTDSFLESVFDENELNSFVKQQFNLVDDIDGLIYRFQLDKVLENTCEIFTKNTNLDISLQLNLQDIRQQIQLLSSLEQFEYLSKIKIYCESTVLVDLANLIASHCFQEYQITDLLQNKKSETPLKIGDINLHFRQSLQNKIGIFQSKDQFEKNALPNETYHICRIVKNQMQIDFCKVIKIKDQVCYYRLINYQYKYNRSKKITNLKNIHSAIWYTNSLKTTSQVDCSKLLFIDNRAHFYINQDCDFFNRIYKETRVNQNLILTQRNYSLVFQGGGLNENELLFKDTRIKIIDSTCLNDEKENLEEFKKDKRIFEVVPCLTRQPEAQYGSRQKDMTLNKIFAILSFPDSQNSLGIPPINDELKQENKEHFIHYCKIAQAREGQSTAGIQRSDEIQLYSFLNNQITKKQKLNCYIQHERFAEIVYIPEIEHTSKKYILKWTPKIKGNYQLVINGEPVRFKFQVSSRSPQIVKYIETNLDNVQCFCEQELKFEMSDEYNNFITKMDNLRVDMKVISKTQNIVVKSKCECKDSYVALNLTLQSLIQKESELCDLEIKVFDETILKSLKINVKQNQLPKIQRINKFTQKFHYKPCHQKISVERQDFLGSLKQLDAVIGQNLMEFIFVDEIAKPGKGTQAEYFTLFGEALKNKQNKLFTSTQIPYIYFIYNNFATNEEGMKNAYFIGFLLAYALANKLELGISFALPFWKVLFGVPIEFSDLQHILDQHTFQNYECLRELSDEQLNVLEITFINQADEKELCSNGSQRKLCRQNLEEYLQLTATHLIYGQHQMAFEDLKNGFKRQYDPKMITDDFSLDELNSLIDHSDYYINNKELVDKIYFNGDTNKDFIVNYVLQASQEKLKLLLQFITGEKYPRMEQGVVFNTLTSNDYNKDLLPTADVCEEILLIIPAYETYEVFEKKMNQALEWGGNYFGQK